MTLLEILVLELPKRGGWPDGVRTLEQYGSGFVYDSRTSYTSEFPLEMADFWSTSLVTREQYEAALAAVETEWNGEGLPPVGCECEIKRVADWMPVTIKFISTYHTVFTTFGGTEDCYQTCSLQFRPIHSEADRKRDETINTMVEVYRNALGDTEDAFSEVYSAIAAGKIPHLKIV